MEKIKAPGLVWQKRRNGYYEPIWKARPKDVEAGYKPATVSLRFIESFPDQMVAKCDSLEADLRLWRTGYERELEDFDGKIATLLDHYERDPESPYQKLRPGSLVPYRHYIPYLRREIGQRLVTKVTGIDIMKWHREWSDNGQKLAASSMRRAILRSAVSFGVMSRFAGCADFLVVIKETNSKLPSPRRRETVVTAEQVMAARANAHKDGRPAWALAYALVYETTLRLWDVIGQWVPMDSPGMSRVLDPNTDTKWFGLQWEDINENLVLKYKPSKTEGRTGKTVAYPLPLAPMVMEELEHWPPARRKGPVIVSRLGRPPHDEHFRDGWAKDRKAAGVSAKVWARDLRASGITEARAGGVDLDDAGKVAGHSGTITTGIVYDRANLEAAERFAEARLKVRKKSDNTG